MPLEAHEPRLGRLGDELGVEVLVPGHEGHVHQRAVARLDGGREELRLVEEVVEQGRLLGVALPHRSEPTVLLDPLEDLAADVDAPAVGRVVERAGVGLRLEAQHRGHAGQVLGDEVLAHDHDLHARGTDVLLDAGVDQAVTRDVDRLGEEHRALIGHQDVALGVGQLRELGAVDGVVLADVEVARVLADGQVGAVGDVREVLVGRARHRHGVAEDLRLLEGLLGPVAGDDVVGLAVGREVHEDRREEQRVAALREDDLVVIRDAHEVAQRGLGVVDDLLEDGRSVAHLHDAHAAAGVVEHLVRALPEDLLGQHGGTGGEVVHACHVFLLCLGAFTCESHLMTAARGAGHPATRRLPVRNAPDTRKEAGDAAADCVRKMTLATRCEGCYSSSSHNGWWRSLVAHLTGGQGVAGSNPVHPTT